MISRILQACLIFYLFSLIPYVANASVIVSGDGLDMAQRKVVVETLSACDGLVPLMFSKDPSLVNDPAYARMFEGGPENRLSFFADTFKAVLPEAKLKMKMVPQTVWDLFVLCKMAEMRSRSKEEATAVLSRYNYTEHSYKDKSSDHKTALYFDFSTELLTQLEGRDASLELLCDFMTGMVTKLKSFDSVPHLQASTLTIMMKDIHADWTSKDSILLQGLKIEWQAMMENCVPMFRSTSIQSLVEEKPDFATIDLLLQPIRENTVLLDVPYYGKDYMVAKDACQYVAEYAGLFKEYFPTYGDSGTDWSFSSSLLAGGIYDGYNKAKSASTFVFHRRSNHGANGARRVNNLLYAVSVPRKELLGVLSSVIKGEVGALPALGILSSGESFHPRVIILPTYPEYWDPQYRDGNVESAKAKCLESEQVGKIVKVLNAYPQQFEECSGSMSYGAYNLRFGQLVMGLLVKYGLPMSLNGNTTDPAAVALIKGHYQNLIDAAEIECNKMLRPAPTE
jgi:hypothetical protein